MALTNGAVHVKDLLGGTPLAVAGVTTVWTDTFLLEKDVTYSFEFIFSSPGTVECDLSLEQGNTPPATEGAVSGNMVVPESAGYILENVGDKVRHIVAYTPKTSRFLRVKVEGTGANNAGTTLDELNVATIKNR